MDLDVHASVRPFRREGRAEPEFQTRRRHSCDTSVSSHVDVQKICWTSNKCFDVHKMFWTSKKFLRSKQIGGRPKKMWDVQRPRFLRVGAEGGRPRAREVEDVVVEDALRVAMDVVHREAHDRVRKVVRAPRRGVVRQRGRGRARPHEVLAALQPRGEAGVGALLGLVPGGLSILAKFGNFWQS